MSKYYLIPLIFINFFINGFSQNTIRNPKNCDSLFSKILLDVNINTSDSNLVDSFCKSKFLLNEWDTSGLTFYRDSTSDELEPPIFGGKLIFNSFVPNNFSYGYLYVIPRPTGKVVILDLQMKLCYNSQELCDSTFRFIKNNLTYCGLLVYDSTTKFEIKTYTQKFSNIKVRKSKAKNIHYILIEFINRSKIFTLTAVNKNNKK